METKHQIHTHTNRYQNCNKNVNNNMKCDEMYRAKIDIWIRHTNLTNQTNVLDTLDDHSEHILNEYIVSLLMFSCIKTLEYVQCKIKCSNKKKKTRKTRRNGLLNAQKHYKSICSIYQPIFRFNTASIQNISIWKYLAPFIRQ